MDATNTIVVIVEIGMIITGIHLILTEVEHDGHEEDHDYHVERKKPEEYHELNRFSQWTGLFLLG